MPKLPNGCTAGFETGLEQAQHRSLCYVVLSLTVLFNHLSEATLHMSSLIVAAHIFLQQNWWILRSLVLLFYCVVQRHTPVSVFYVCNTASASVTMLHCSAVSFSKMLLLFILHIHHPFFFHVVFHRFSHALPLLPICHWPITSTVS